MAAGAWLVLEQIPVDNCRVPGTQADTCGVLGTRADVGYYYSKDHNDKDSDDAPMHQEESEWSHCIGGTRLAAGNSAAGLLLHSVRHMMRDDKEDGDGESDTLQTWQMCSVLDVTKWAVVDVGFSHILLLSVIICCSLVTGCRCLKTVIDVAAAVTDCSGDASSSRGERPSLLMSPAVTNMSLMLLLVLVVLKV